MLSIKENETLAVIDRGTPMGDYIRRFWMPFLMTSDLPDADGEPVNITLMGETLLAFRNTDGNVGLIQRNCPHRWASLFYGRNEESGIRCSYHGWKFDINGSCVDMPTEAEDSNFRDKVQIVSYPVVERGGALWTYMGPPEFQQEFPEFEFFNVPEEHQYISWNRQECNYAQAIEGGIDSAHSNFLHSSLDAYWRTEGWVEQGKRTTPVTSTPSSSLRTPTTASPPAHVARPARTTTTGATTCSCFLSTPCPRQARARSSFTPSCR